MFEFLKHFKLTIIVSIVCLTLAFIWGIMRSPEHGAMYAIGALALILLCSSFIHLPVVVVGLIGIVIIGIAFYQSIQVNKIHLKT